MSLNVPVLNKSSVWRGGLTALVVSRMLMWWLFQHDIPRMHDHYDWQFFYSGDETLFFARAQELVAGEFKSYRVLPNTIGVGLPFMMAGVILLTGSTVYEDIRPYLVILNGLLFASLSVAVMATLARQLTGSRAQGLLVGTLWTFLPYLLWLGFGIHPQAEVLRNAYVSRQMWVSGITDSPSMFFVTLGMVLAWQGSYGRNSTRISRVALVVSGGVCMGFAAAIRIHVLPVMLLVLAALAWSRQWRNALLVMAGMLTGFLPQFWHNSTIDDHFLNTPYINGFIRFGRGGRLEFNPLTMPWSPGFLIENMMAITTRLPLVILAGLVGLMVAAFAFIRCWQRRGAGPAILMFGAPLASFALHAVTFIYMTDPIRFTLPALAFGLTGIVWTGFVLIDEILRLRSARSAYARKVSEV